MTDAEIIQQINDHLDAGKAMGITYMRDGLEVYRRELERLKSTHKAPVAVVEGLPKLSKRQSEAFDFIVNYFEQHGFSPSVRDVQEGLGYESSSTAFGIIKRLEEKGYIKRNGQRGLTITGLRGRGNN